MLQPFFVSRAYSIVKSIEDKIERATLKDIKRGKFQDGISKDGIQKTVDAYLAQLPEDVTEQRKKVTDDLLEQMLVYITAFKENDKPAMQKSENNIIAYAVLLRKILKDGYGRELHWSPDDFLKDPAKPIEGLNN